MVHVPDNTHLDPWPLVGLLEHQLNLKLLLISHCLSLKKAFVRQKLCSASVHIFSDPSRLYAQITSCCSALLIYVQVSSGQVPIHGAQIQLPSLLVDPALQHL